MKAFSDMRRVKKAQDFAFNAGRRGGSFETSCSPEQLFAWLKEAKVQVTEESAASLSARPIYKNGSVGPEVLMVQVSPGNKLATLVVINVQLSIKPDKNNLMANNPMTIPPIFGLLLKVGKADPGWQPA